MLIREPIKEKALNYRQMVINSSKAINGRRRRVSLSKLLKLYQLEVRGAMNEFKEDRDWKTGLLFYASVKCVLYSGIEIPTKWALNRIGEVHGPFPHLREVHGPFPCLNQGQAYMTADNQKSVRLEYQKLKKTYQRGPPKARERSLTLPLPDTNDLKWQHFCREGGRSVQRTSEQLGSPLFRLPLELRLIIWKHALHVGRVNHIKRLKFDPNTGRYREDPQTMIRMKGVDVDWPSRLATPDQEGNSLILSRVCRRM